jgi:hypothetical protein
MLRVWLLLISSVLTTQLCGALQAPLVNDIDDLPAYYAYLVKRLAEQPLFSGYGAKVEQCKILPLIDWYDTKIFNILNKNVEAPLEVHDFGNGSANQRAVVDGQGNQHFLNSGIELWLDVDKPILLNGLSFAYIEVIEDLKSGWYQSTVEENPDIMFKQPEKNWFLFIKKQHLLEEDSLIRFFAMKFNLTTKIDSMCEWLKKPSGFEERGMPYLWIRKDALEEVQRKFKFRFFNPKRSLDDEASDDEAKSKRPRKTNSTGAT